MMIHQQPFPLLPHITNTSKNFLEHLPRSFHGIPQRKKGADQIGALRDIKIVKRQTAALPKAEYPFCPPHSLYSKEGWA